MAVHRAIGTRDPFTYPKLENDNDFRGINDTMVIFFKWHIFKQLKNA